MGYFSNGSEGFDYASRYCDNCAHGRNQDDAIGCAVWLAHEIHNYDEGNNPDSILHLLIPREKGGGNGECRMFLPVVPPPVSAAPPS